MTRGKYWITAINPVAGCWKVSDACRYCYAEEIHERFRTAEKPVKFYSRPFSEVTLRPEQLEKFDHLGRTPKIVFVGNMCDLFHEEVPFDYIREVFGRISRLGEINKPARHTFLILTKRAKRMKEFFEHYPAVGPSFEARQAAMERYMQHVFIGVTCENQARADERIPYLLETPAAHRWASVEPLLGPIDLTEVSYRAGGNPKGTLITTNTLAPNCPRVDLIIAGFESGRHARLAHAAWAYDLKHQCEAANVKFYWKQWGDGAIMGDNRQNLNDLDDMTHPDSNQVLDGIDYSKRSLADIWRVS